MTRTTKRIRANSDHSTNRSLPKSPVLELNPPWFAQDRAYRRLPIAPRLPVPAPVATLADCTAGGQIAFRTSSKQVAVRVTLAGSANMIHMPATGQCGVDLYVGMPGAQRFHNVSKFDVTKSKYEGVLFEHPEGRDRQFTLNLPLYMGVKNIQVGVIPKSEMLSPAPWADNRKIVVYGTSITQGGCASRPGMAYTNILSRALNMEFVNLGFSGNGRGEPEIRNILETHHHEGNA